MVLLGHHKGITRATGVFFARTGSNVQLYAAAKNHEAATDRHRQLQAARNGQRQPAIARDSSKQPQTSTDSEDSVQ